VKAVAKFLFPLKATNFKKYPAPRSQFVSLSLFVDGKETRMWRDPLYRAATCQLDTFQVSLR